jgi:hypothetical protein
MNKFRSTRVHELEEEKKKMMEANETTAEELASQSHFQI